VRWSPVSGSAQGTLYSPGGFSLADAEVTPDGSEVWVCNSSFGSPACACSRPATGLLVAGPLFCVLPPQGIAFDSATGQVAGVDGPSPSLSLSAPSPNPARGPVSLRLAGLGQRRGPRRGRRRDRPARAQLDRSPRRLLAR
jgi:hypothetical protein